MQLDAPWNLSIGLDQERGSPRLSSQLSQRFCCCSLLGLFEHVLVFVSMLHHGNECLHVRWCFFEAWLGNECPLLALWPVVLWGCQRQLWE